MLTHAFGRCFGLFIINLTYNNSERYLLFSVLFGVRVAKTEQFGIKKIKMAYESSSSSSDEEILEIVRYIERPRRYLQRENQLQKYEDSEFRDRFRLTKECFNILIELIGDNLNTLTERRTSLSVTEQLLITLRFYATGMYISKNNSVPSFKIFLVF